MFVHFAANVVADIYNWYCHHLTSAIGPNLTLLYSSISFKFAFLPNFRRQDIVGVVV